MKNKLLRADNNFGGVLSATLTAGDVTSASLTPVPTEAPGIIVLKAGEAQEEHIYYKEKDSGAGTISGLIRDYTNLNGGVGFEHINTTPFEVMQASEYLNNIVDALIEGYIDEQQTLLFVSTTSFTVKTNKTAIYTAGRILRFNQDSTKIAKVVSSSYSAGTGLTTVVVANTYADVPNPITYVEIAIQPKGATALQDVYYAEDAGASDAYAVSINSAITALFNGLTIVFKANTANTGAATLNVNGIGATTIKKLNDQDLGDGDIEVGQRITVVYDGTNFQMQSQIATIPSSFSLADIKAPQGFLLNGKIVPSVTSNNLTVAIKGIDGNDPSASNPVYVRIGDTVRSITAALSVTKNAGTNWCNSGGAELATNEVDYFVYLGYNTTDGVTIGFSRIPYASIYSNFSATTTNEKYCAISTITNAAAGDTYENIGRFAATLSAGAGYTWTVPTFTSANLIQRPIYESRWLTWTPITVGWTSYSNAWSVYQVRNGYITIKWSASTGASNSATTSITIPFAVLNYPSGPTGSIVDNSAIPGSPGKYSGVPNSNVITFYKDYANTAWTASGNKGSSLDMISFQI